MDLPRKLLRILSSTFCELPLNKFSERDSEVSCRDAYA